MKKIKAGILGATGMVGQRFVQILAEHPWFDVVCVAASERSAGKSYTAAVEGRWYMDTPVPERIGHLVVKEVEKDIDAITSQCRVVFSALDMDKEQIKHIEDTYAGKGAAVVSNNSAHRWTDDVPLIMPEVNAEHVKLIDIQRKNRGWTTGLIAVKPNCSLQSYVPIIKALERYGPESVEVTALQAISGAGKTFATWPEMIDNVIPLIKNEEEKSEQEPMKILGTLTGGRIENATKPTISATCIRVPVTDGHMASVAIRFRKNPSRDEFLDALINYKNPLAGLNLPSAPALSVKYFTEEDRPQTKLDRGYENGMGITAGRLREDPLGGWKIVALSHNTTRGAAGGAVLVAELLVAKNYIKK